MACTADKRYESRLERLESDKRTRPDTGICRIAEVGRLSIRPRSTPERYSQPGQDPARPWSYCEFLSTTSKQEKKKQILAGSEYQEVRGPQQSGDRGAL